MPELRRGWQNVRTADWLPVSGEKVEEVMTENRDEILSKVEKLRQAYRDGLLGGEKMPEDENPQLERGSRESYLYFTLPMALNYQRNSYKLWECANAMYREHPEVFDTARVVQMTGEELQEILVHYKVALQQNKQPQIWRRLCQTMEEELDGDIRNLFIRNEYSVERIKKHIAENKKRYPYLGGIKICNYWLYVLEQYTDCTFTDRANITVAPDTHVVQASKKIGIISEAESMQANVQSLVAERWSELLLGTGLIPTDIHTPMWLWSRGKFQVEI